MSLRNEIASELKRLIGTTSPTSVTATDVSGLEMRVDFTAVDSMSCSFLQIELFVPHLQQAAFDVLKQWADSLSKKISYLLENIGPLEYDPDAGQVLIRSTSPSQLPDGTQYYEIVLSSKAGGNFSLCRYRSTKGQPGRDAVDVTVTHEVLLKLADDLVDTLPGGTP